MLAGSVARATERKAEIEAKIFLIFAILILIIKGLLLNLREYYRARGGKDVFERKVFPFTCLLKARKPDDPLYSQGELRRLKKYMADN